MCTINNKLLSARVLHDIPHISDSMVQERCDCRIDLQLSQEQVCIQIEDIHEVELSAVFSSEYIGVGPIIVVVAFIVVVVFSNLS